MGGVSTRNFRMFRKLCGENVLKNVVIVTNRWEEVDLRVGEAREAELQRGDLFFKPVLAEGARMARHDGTTPSAKRIIRLLLNNHPLPLRIQEELVDEGKRIIETDASEVLEEELQERIAQHERKMQAVIKEMRQAMKDRDEKAGRELGRTQYQMVIFHTPLSKRSDTQVSLTGEGSPGKPHCVCVSLRRLEPFSLLTCHKFSTLLFVNPQQSTNRRSSTASWVQREAASLPYVRSSPSSALPRGLTPISIPTPR